MNLVLLLEMIAELDDGRVVIGPQSGGMTGSELLTRACRAAGMLRKSNVANLGFLDVNTESLPVALFAAAVAGLPFAPLNFRLPDDKLREIASRIAPAVVVAGAAHANRLGGLEGIRMVTTEDFSLASVDEARPLADASAVDGDEIAVLLFTSGTTGKPKAAVLRHRHLTSYIFSTVDFASAGSDETQLVSVPAYHIAGVSTVLSCVSAGRRIVYLPTFDAPAWVEAVRREHVTHALLVPTMMARVLAVIEADGAGLPSLRHLAYGGGRMPVELIQRMMAELPHVDFVNAYGLTETSSTISVLTPEDHRAATASDDPVVRRRLGSVGRPLPTLDLEIRDADGRPVPAGERGEVHVRGDQIAGEYRGRSVLTVDNWFPTNDAGWLDSEGYLFLEGRLDDVIVRGAENLSPGEIEDVLLSHTCVADAAIVGVPHAEWGETLAAAVVLQAGCTTTEAELKAFVKERLRSTKTPEWIEFRADLPYNETGKLLRRVLRAELAARAGNHVIVR